jgi:catechol 2,3-dioxygenase-like lactoylglutathione lyase family enzyme
MENYLFIEVSMACSDCEAMEKFWVDLFGAKVIFRGQMAGQPFTRLTMPGVSLIFRQDPNFAAPAGPGQEWEYRNHLGLRVDDLDRAIADLESRGANFVLTPAKVRELQQKMGGGGMGKYLQTTYIAPPLSRERIDAGEFKHDVAILVGPDNLWVELNQIKEPADTQWYPK